MTGLSRRKLFKSFAYSAAAVTSTASFFSTRKDPKYISKAIIDSPKSLIGEAGERELFNNLYPRQDYLELLLSFTQEGHILERYITRENYRFQIVTVWKSQESLNLYKSKSKAYRQELENNLGKIGASLTIEERPISLAHKLIISTGKKINRFFGKEQIISDIKEMKSKLV